jgi:hypothetical protein
LLGDINEFLADINAVNKDSAPRQFMTMTTWTTSDVENSHPMRQIQGSDEEIDLLNRALRK